MADVCTSMHATELVLQQEYEAESVSVIFNITALYICILVLVIHILKYFS